ncbi:penicillin-binding protein 2 [Paenibacillus sp. UNCCL117]|uniref:peptidoglycan D,D-transpeptidase FtsI family protein n=1 Tax=unclassified Paenibacillus TaxID=185978 RepID=UPI000888EC7A|nr:MULTISPECIES: penicillin-binding transpeptidase domain-containing protein [unclassified Paenibacillus]SDE03102.1 penicillin-binding protein 2 [Paenibacillus sp. cl123]SFW57342.1 penicillin-binding protein 2 [Paenibacillus sp. UNCCL117]
MKKPIGMEDRSKQESGKGRNFTFRINIFFFFTFFLFSVLIVQLADLQFVKGKELLEEKSRIESAATPIPPIRGNIFDRESAPLAYTVPVQSLYFRIEQQQPKEEVIALAKRLEQIFADNVREGETPLTAEEIIKEMDVGYDLNGDETEKKPSYNSVPRRVKTDLSNAEMAYILEHRDELKWIEITEESIRTYDPVKPVAVQLVGYMRPYSQAREPKNGLSFYQDKTTTKGYMDTEYVGYDGIEFMYQKELRGTNGTKTYPVNALNKIIGQAEVTPPTKGNNLYLTINKDIQSITEKAIMDHLAYLKSPAARSNPLIAKGRNAVAGYAVAMEVETGKVVTMASMPDYDPKVWAGGIKTNAQYLQIQPFINNGTITTAYPDYPTAEERNRHPTSIVYVGSVIKPLSVLIGLKEGLFGLNTVYNDTGIFHYGKDNSAKVSNSDGKAWGPINATKAIQYSSNTFMSAKIGYELHRLKGEKAVEIWDSYLAKFGLGVSTETGLRTESPGLSEYLTNTKESHQQRMVFASWGQNEKYTTMQLAQYVTTLATRGERLKPLLVDKIESYNGDPVQSFERVVLDKIEFPKEYWDAVFKGMAAVGISGFDDFKYPLARKTGTSTQRVAGNKEVDNAVFIAFAPIENPKLAVAVVVPEGGFGSYGAAPIARKIFDAYDYYYGLDGVPKKAAADAAAGAGGAAANKQP